MDENLTHPEKTIHGVGEVPTAPKRWMDFGKAKRLYDIKGWMWFSPALLYLHSGLGDRPWVEYTNEMGKVPTLGHHLFKEAIFTGLDAPDGNKDWNRALWAIPDTEWPDVENYLLSVQSMDPQSGNVVGFGIRDIEILDPLIVDSGAALDIGRTISVATIGIRSNACQLVIMESEQMMGKPFLKKYPPSAQMQRTAEVLFGGGSPADAVRGSEEC